MTETVAVAAPSVTPELARASDATEKEAPTVSAYKWDREAAFFGVHPACYLEDMRNCVEDYACNGMDALEKALTREKDAKSDEMKRLICQGVDKLYEFMSSHFQEPQDKFEAYVLKNIFRIPDDVVLPEELPQHTIGGTADVKETEMITEVRDLQRKLLSARFVNHALKKEMADIDKELGKYNELSSSVALETHLLAPSLLQAQCQSVRSYLSDVEQLKLSAAANMFKDCTGSIAQSLSRPVAADDTTFLNAEDVGSFAESFD